MPDSTQAADEEATRQDQAKVARSLRFLGSAIPESLQAVLVEDPESKDLALKLTRVQRALIK